MDPIHQVLEDQNRVASVAEDSNEYYQYELSNHFASIGVVGAIIAILIVAKVTQYKELEKLLVFLYF